MSDKKIAVIICSEGDFDALLHLCPTNREEFHKVSNINHTRGMRFSETITLGGAHHVPGYEEILYAVKERVR